MTSIREKIYNTISDLNKWSEVLEALVNATGSAKGIISLRSRVTADIVIPEDVRQELASPLVFGFSEDEINSYINNYILFDPWTEFENLYHPNSPYTLSRYTDERSLKQSKFWEWLEPQNISDCAIIKLGDSSPKYWIAMNLYFERSYSIKETTMKYLELYKQDMQTAWQHGQAFRLRESQSGYTDYFLGINKHPIILIDTDAMILKKNNAASHLINRNPSIKDSKGRISIDQIDLKKALSIHAKKATRGIKKTLTTEFKDTKYKYNLSTIGPIENTLGETTAVFMLTIRVDSSVGDEKSWEYFWESCNLTERELQLLEILGKDGHVVHFQKHYGIAKGTAHTHWQNLKRKTGVKDRAEISYAYKVFTQNNN